MVSLISVAMSFDYVTLANERSNKNHLDKHMDFPHADLGDSVGYQIWVEMASLSNQPSESCIITVSSATLVLLTFIPDMF